MRAAAHLLAAGLALVPPALAADDPGREVESRLLAQLTAESMSGFHRRITREPHVAGTPGGKAVALEIESALKGMGLATETRTYQAYLSHPKRIAVRLLRPDARRLATSEPADTREPASAHPDLTPGFIAYSASGRAEGPVVYVNYGLPADYDALEAKGKSARGAIVLARYGKVHRAVKVFTAEERGARGILIYSDPADDGSGKGEVWPQGPWRGPDMLQRGNAKYSWFWHGDPLTPGTAALASAPRRKPGDVPTLPKIPAVPLAWSAAREILSRLEGSVGPGPATVEMDVAMEAGQKPITNVLASVQGYEERDRWVFLGTHHDAWTFGGVDPGSAVATVLELARACAELAKAGWRPRRTLVFAFWDAEEYGLIGSTEYAEERAEELRTRAVAYVNTDMYLAGRLEAGGTASLRDFMQGVARDVADPGGASSLLEAWKRDYKKDTFDLDPLGSGADFVPFQDHLGLPTLSLEFGIEGSYGAYHSSYDTQRYMETFGDPGGRYGLALAELLGRTVLRLATAPLLPFRFGHTAQTLDGYLARLGDPRLEATRSRVALLAEAARDVDQALPGAEGSDLATLRAVNDRLLRAETVFAADAEGWYRHAVYGWDIYALYSGDTLPGLRRAAAGGDAAAFDRERLRLEAAIDAAAAELRAAAELLR